MNQGEKKKKVTARWDAIANRAWIEIMLEEIAAHNRPQGVLNSIGYANLVAKFKERTGRSYDQKQMKNRWDALKCEYTTWKTLKLNASRLGRDPKTGTIAASEEWWNEKIEAMPGCKKFKLGPLEHEDELDIIFEMSTCTNESARVVGVDDQNQSGSVEDKSGDMTGADKGAKKRVAEAEASPKKHVKNFRDKQFKRFVDSFVQRASSSKSSATSSATDVVRQEIAEMLDSVIEAGAEEGSDEHFYATQLLIKKEYRDVFATLKKPEVKLAWLKRTWEERKQRYAALVSLIMQMSFSSNESSVNDEEQEDDEWLFEAAGIVAYAMLNDGSTSKKPRKVPVETGIQWVERKLNDEEDCYTMFRMSKYYLVDSGYPNRKGYLAPYKGQRYHISQFQNSGRPIGLKEVFNHAHSSLRNVIERSFGVLKMKWRILLNLRAIRWRSKRKS